MAEGDWYYAKDNQQQGPVPFSNLTDLLRTGGLAATDLVWRPGMANWTPAGQVPELGGAPAAPPPAGAPAPYGQPQGQGVYGQPAAQHPYGQQPGYYPQQPRYAGAPVPNYLVPAILATIFCCMPMGIVSIVYAAQVNSKLMAGDYAGAVDSSNKAKLWVWWNVGIMAALFVLYLVFIVIVVIAEGA